MAAFPEIERIRFEGPKSSNPLAFRHYNADEKIEGKTMKDHLRFSVVYWHTFRNPLGDPFGPGTAIRPWDDGSNSVENAQKRVRAAFEFIEKLGAPFYAFHDRDVAPEGANAHRIEQEPRCRRQSRSRKSSSAPASSCSGAPPICSATRATCTARPPAATPTSLPTPRRR